MPDDSAADAAFAAVHTARVPARAWVAAQLERAPWNEVAVRSTLLVASPPRASWMTADLIEDTTPVAWLLIDRSDVRGLPSTQREPLAIHGVFVEETPEGTVVVLVAEAAELLIEGVSRRSLEVRWILAHAEALHDPLRRLETLWRALSALPVGGEERILRPLYLQASESLAAFPGGALPAFGELAAAVSRLACVLDSGLHPPVEWLATEARTTALGARLGGWLDDAAHAVGGDSDVLRRVMAARDGVVRMMSEPIKELLGAPDWLTAPRTFALRPPR